jgi:hypothetical protein
VRVSSAILVGKGAHAKQETLNRYVLRELFSQAKMAEFSLNGLITLPQSNAATSRSEAEILVYLQRERAQGMDEL